MTTGRHTAPAPPAPAPHTRPTPTGRRYIAQVTGMILAFGVILGAGFTGTAVLLTHLYITYVTP